MEQVLEEAEFLVAADEWRLECLAAVASAALRDDAHGPPGRDRAGLALQRLLPGFLEGDRLARGALGRLADQDHAGRGDRLEASGGVHKVAGDHALVRGTKGDRRLPGQDRGPRLDGRAESVHCVDQLESGPDCSLRVVLMCDRRAPHGHHRITDELLNCPSIARHHL